MPKTETFDRADTGWKGARPAALLAAVTTPLDSSFSCDQELLAERCRYLLNSGCDGVAVFGTTGEGPLLGVDQRMSALEHVLASGIEASRIVVSASAMTMPEIVRLARHAVDAGCVDVLLMPPFFFRDRISDAGAFNFYATAIDGIGRPDLRAILYHFPDITGVSITPELVRRLTDRFPGIVAGIKDSGGDWEYTENLITRFSDLAVLTGEEVHVPFLLKAGGAGTICGLANIVPGLMRQLFDAPSLSARRRYLPLIHAIDAVMSRGTFVCCLKAVIAAESGNLDWLRVLPPLYPLPAYERRTIVSGFRRVAAEVSSEAPANPLRCER